MDNIITTDYDDIIGYYKDLQKYLKEQAQEFLKDTNWEEVKDLCDLLLDLNAWADNENLLVISNNNGMGYTIKEYRDTIKEYKGDK